MRKAARPKRQPKTLGKWGEVLVELAELDISEFDRDLARVHSLMTSETAHYRVTSLVQALNGFAQERPRAFSLLLQAWLSMLGILWPKGVFRHDYSLPERGPRPHFELGCLAGRLASQGLSWRAVAKTLVPDLFRENGKEAARRVKRAAMAADEFQSFWNELASLSVRPFCAPGQERGDISQALIDQTLKAGVAETLPRLLRIVAKEIQRSKLAL
jgi:hypothetical protein